MWAIFTAYMFIASLRTTGAVALVFLLLTITFLILGIGNASLVGTHHVTNGTIKLGGYLGIATAIVAWYASFAARHQLDLRPGGGTRRSARALAKRAKESTARPALEYNYRQKSPHESKAAERRRQRRRSGLSGGRMPVRWKERLAWPM